jgi:hypothetical protein
MEAWIDHEIESSSRVRDLFAGRLEMDSGKLVKKSLAFRDYLRIASPDHRRALTKMVLSSHSHLLSPLSQTLCLLSAFMLRVLSCLQSVWRHQRKSIFTAIGSTEGASRKNSVLGCFQRILDISVISYLTHIKNR